MRRLIDAWFGLLRRAPVLLGFVLVGFIAYGGWIASRSEIEAFPEFTNVQVQVITPYPGKAAEEVERQVTEPLEVATTGVSGLINQRSVSLFGLSVITLTFDDEVKAKQARLDVSQRLGDADLRDGVKPTLSPESTPIGEIYRYTVDGNLPVDELRLIEDWRLEREFKGIPGVADVVSFGGPTRTIEVRLDPTRMKALGLTVPGVAQALGQNHANAGGSVITHGEESYIVRSLGLYESPESLESAVIATQKSVPIRVRDIGSVQLGHRPRLGIVGHNDQDDVVEGIILLRQGADSLQTCHGIKEKIEALNANVLPKGVTIRPYYNRTDLIRLSSHTVFHNIFFGILLVLVVLWFGLGRRYWPLILAVALIIPFSLLAVFASLRLLGYTPNLISLGAVDFGIIIETAIFSAEAVILALSRQERREDGGVTRAFSEVLAPALLCALMLVIAFVPILSLQRVEGRIFRPLGVTLIAALLGGQLGTLIFVPVASFLCPIGPSAESRTDRFLAGWVGICERRARWLSGLRHPALWIGVALGVAVLGLGSTLGREFLPDLNEGSLWIRAAAPSTISMEAATELAARIRLKLREIPEAVDVVSQVGRPDDGTDINGFDNLEFFVALVPPDQWRSATTIDGFTKLAQEKLGGIEGVEFSYSQYIKDNVDEAISGVKGELVAKVFGPQLPELQRLGDSLAEVLRTVPGAEDVGVEKLLGQPELRFNMDRNLLARYGLRVSDAEDVLETALLGKVAAKLYDDQGRAIDVVVKPDLHAEPNARLLSSLSVLTPDGAKIPLGEISSQSLVEGVGRVYREKSERRIAVKCSVRGRPVVGFVNDASGRIRDRLKLPEGYRIEWSGSFENAERASQQLLVIVPICLLAMIVLLYSWFGSARLVGLLLWEIPFAGLGGFLFLKLFGLNFSISAAAGGIVLIGVAFLTGMMLISQYRRERDAWRALREAGKAILISNGVAIIGLIPAALSHGIGSETAKPFAVMILGGLISSLILSLVALPALMSVLEKDELSREKST